MHPAQRKKEGKSSVKLFARHYNSSELQNCSLSHFKTRASFGENLLSRGFLRANGLVAAGLWPAVEPGILPGGKSATTTQNLPNCLSRWKTRALIPGGETPPSTSGRMPDATSLSHRSKPVPPATRSGRSRSRWLAPESNWRAVPRCALRAGWFRRGARCRGFSHCAVR